MSSTRQHFVDIGANLTDGNYAGEYNDRQVHEPDLRHVLARASDAGVTRVLVTAGTLAQSREALALANAHAALYSTVGVHPTRANVMNGGVDAYVQELRGVIREGGARVVAVGECGLDYDRMGYADKETQMKAFLAQFELAEDTGLPMFLHDRNTGGECARVLRENRHRFGNGVVHSFTGSQEELQAHLANGMYIGLNGCSFKTEENIAVAKTVPLERLMLETDGPYCEIRRSHPGYDWVESRWPVKDKKKWAPEFCVKGRVEPCHVRQVCEVLAKARGISTEEVARAAFNNSFSVFFANEVEGSSPYDLSVNAALP